MQKDNFFQKVSGLLNTSSETFMLIALVSLFVFPVVMAKNLEPVVKNAYQNQATAYIPSTADKTTTEEKVLGVSTAVTPGLTVKDAVIEDAANLAFFNEHSSTPTEKNYVLTVQTTKRFGKIPLFKVVNTSSSTLSYNLSGTVNGDLKVQSNQQKILYVDNAPYAIDTNTTFPLQVLVSPGQEVIVSLMSSRTSPTNVTLSLAENSQ